MAPAEGIEERLSLSRSGQGPAHGPDQALMDAVVRELPVEVVVDLGEVEVPLTQLAQLSVGDLLILNRRVSDPLTARVGGRAKFIGWPGKMGPRQAVHIVSIVE